MGWPGHEALQKPRFKHQDGDGQSIWMGRFGEYDLWADFDENPRSIKTVIARDSDNGYVSGLEFVSRYPALAECKWRAEDYLRETSRPSPKLAAKRMPFKSIPLNAFNLWEGAAIVLVDRVYIVHSFTDYGASEKVLVVTHRGDDADLVDFYDIPFLFDYMAKVDVIGNVRNPKDYDDNDWGN